MGLRFRKSFGTKGLRVNISKSGVGYSVGGKGYRLTKMANGRTRSTISIPGTGLSYVTESSNGSRTTRGKSYVPMSPKISTIYLIFIIVVGFGIIFGIINLIDTIDYLNQYKATFYDFNIEYTEYRTDNYQTYYIYLKVSNMSNAPKKYTFDVNIVSKATEEILLQGKASVIVSEESTEYITVEVYSVTDEIVVLEKDTSYRLNFANIQVSAA